MLLLPVRSIAETRELTARIDAARSLWRGRPKCDRDAPTAARPVAAEAQRGSGLHAAIARPLHGRRGTALQERDGAWSRGNGEERVRGGS